MIQIEDYVIINIDNQYPDPSAFSGLKVISCGLNSKSSVTASSISENDFVFWLQRSITTLSGAELSPQEFCVKWRYKPKEIYKALEFITALLILDIAVDAIRSITICML